MKKYIKLFLSFDDVLPAWESYSLGVIENNIETIIENEDFLEYYRVKYYDNDGLEYSHIADIPDGKRARAGVVFYIAQKAARYFWNYHYKDYCECTYTDFLQDAYRGDFDLWLTQQKHKLKIS